MLKNVVNATEIAMLKKNQEDLLILYLLFVEHIKYKISRFVPEINWQCLIKPY